MLAKLSSQGIDLGIVVTNLERSLAFYRDLLGFEDQGENPMPGGGRMRRLLCGESLIKVIELDGEAPAPAPGGGIRGGTGYRYWTISASNLDEIAAACENAGTRIVIAPMELRPGVRIMMLEDPDGNWVEFADYGEG